MAGEGKEKELNLDDEQSADANESGATSSKKNLIMMIVGGILLVGIGAGGAVFFLGGGGDEANAEVADSADEAIPEQERPRYLLLEPPFVINLPDRGRQRFLQAHVTLMSRDRQALLTAEKHMPRIRNNLSNVFSSQSIAAIQSPGGIERIRELAAGEINSILKEEFGEEAIDEVLFESFVMQ